MRPPKNADTVRALAPTAIRTNPGASPASLQE
jgi:hypothetical protein